MSASYSAYGCRAVLPCYTQINKHCYHTTGFVIRNIHGCLLLYLFVSCNICRIGLTFVARVGTWWSEIHTELHVTNCWVLADSGLSLGGQMAAAVLMKPMLSNLRAAAWNPLLLLTVLTNFSQLHAWCDSWLDLLTHPQARYSVICYFVMLFLRAVALNLLFILLAAEKQTKGNCLCLSL